MRGEGPTAMQSSLGYLFSGPLTPTISPSLETSVLHISIPLEEDTHSSIWDTKLTSTDISHLRTDTTDQDMFNLYLKSHITREDDGDY